MTKDRKKSQSAHTGGRASEGTGSDGRRETGTCVGTVEYIRGEIAGHRRDPCHTLPRRLTNMKHTFEAKC